MNCWRCGNELTTDGMDSLCGKCREDFATGPGLCYNGHIFVFRAGLPHGRVPEGTPCACGQGKAHWAHCDKCGQDKLEWVKA